MLSRRWGSFRVRGGRRSCSTAFRRKGLIEHSRWQLYQQAAHCAWIVVPDGQSCGKQSQTGGQNKMRLPYYHCSLAVSGTKPYDNLHALAFVSPTRSVLCQPSFPSLGVQVEVDATQWVGDAHATRLLTALLPWKDENAELLYKMK